jgi:hypothetical protein
MSALREVNAIPYRVSDYRRRNLRHRARGLKAEICRLAKVGIIAQLDATILRADGSVEHLGVISRRFVTTAGVNFIRDAFLNTVEAEAMNYHASGTGIGGEAVGDTALGTEVATRVAGTQASSGAGAYRTTATIPYTGTLAITEHGVLSAAAAGTLLDRSVFAAINVVNGDSIQFQYTITFSAGG